MPKNRPNRPISWFSSNTPTFTAMTTIMSDDDSEYSR